MKNKTVKKLLSRSLSLSLASVTAAGLGFSGISYFNVLSNTVLANAATVTTDTSTAVTNGEKVSAMTYSGENNYTVTTEGGASVTVTYTGTVTSHTSENANKLTFVCAGKELSPADAYKALNQYRTVKVYTKNYNGLFGSYTSRGSESFRIGQLIASAAELTAMEDSDSSITSADDVSLGSAVTNVNTTTSSDGTKVLDGLKVNSTSDNLNPVVVAATKSDTSTLKALVENSSIKLLGSSDGNDDVCDFDGWGIGIGSYGNSKTTIDNTDITTTGVGRTAVESDNGSDVLLENSNIKVNNGTLYDGYLCTADQTKMVNPPWVLGVTGNARATNLLGDNSTMTVYNTDAYAAEWGVLSTDACSNVVLNAINSKISMDLSGDDLTEDTGYGTYAIGSAVENFLGTTIDVPTYATICANGSNVLNYGATTAGTAITTQKYNSTDSKYEDSDVSVTPTESKKTTVNSENFGVDIWGGATVNVNDGTTFNTGSAAFLVKSQASGSFNGATINLDDANINADDGTILQVIDNEDAAATGINMGVSGYSGPVFTDCQYTEDSGWQTTAYSGSGTAAAETLNVTDTDLSGNIYNGSGYELQGSTLNVNLGENATLAGKISATTIKHSTDGGKTQNTTIGMDEYYALGHVVNKAYLNGENDVAVTLSDNAVWNVKGDNYVSSLTVGSDAVLNGTVYVDGVKTVPTAGTTYTGSIEIVAADTDVAQTISASDVTLAAGKSASINATGIKTSAVYTSSDSSVASVDKNGKITANKAGTATITITAASSDIYAAATKTITVTVKPSAAVLKSVSAGTKSLAVKWKSDSTVSGYYVQYATNKSFTNAKTLKVAGGSASSATIKSLKSGTKYYVRVCKYKTINSVAVKGAYSSVKAATTKK